MTYHIGSDVLAGADVVRAFDRDLLPCLGCGAPEPARLGPGAQCDRCHEYRRCHLCSRWTFEEAGVFVHSVDFGGGLRSVCETCWAKGDVESHVDDMEEA
jgi:hypothetical protein